MNSIQLRYWLSEHFLWIMLGLGAAFTLTWLLLHRKRLRLKWYAAVLLAILHTLYGVLCVKVFAFAESGFDGNKPYRTAFPILSVKGIGRTFHKLRHI